MNRNGKKRIIVVDYGCKNGIKNALANLGCIVNVVSGNTSSKEILSLKPNGIVLSNGPGDPKDYREAIINIKKLLLSSVPILGICLGHQLLALAGGGKTYKLPFGHRGNNHSVLDLETGKSFISSHNHGYAVSANHLPVNFTPWFMNLLDQTVEGIKHKNKLIWSVQFHPEARPGTWDTKYIFPSFLKKI